MELRQNLAQEAKSFADEAKISIRKAREKMVKGVKKEKSISKDSIKRMEDYVSKHLIVTA